MIDDQCSMTIITDDDDDDNEHIVALFQFFTNIPRIERRQIFQILIEKKVS